jgi:myo-inositol 2-dehydrogenase/D-chiro-inositol 1-dehydrogenase
MFLDASASARGTESWVRFGLIGNGLAGPLFGGALAAQPGGATLAGVATSRPETARLAAERWGAPIAFESWRELVHSSRIDAVCVATPTGTHAEIAIAAAEAGKHVLVEKPMATCLDDADRMLRAARAAGVTLGVIFMYRFMDTARLMKRAVEDGYLGRPLLGEVAGRFWRDLA